MDVQSHISSKMKLSDQKGRRSLVSFECFPPKTEDGVKNLLKRLDETMKKQYPCFIDFTWGAGGSTSDLTVELSKKVVDFGIIINMHLTCTNMPQELVVKALDEAKAYGITNIVALRGDPPIGQEKWEVSEDGFSCALDLVNFIREKYGDFFHISVAGYPEGHPDAIKPVKNISDLSDDERSRLVSLDDEGKKSFFVCYDDDFVKELEYLKSKIDAGANMIITQLFYDFETFLNFVKKCRDIGIPEEITIVPGIMPLTKLEGFRRMTKVCKTRIPDELEKLLASLPEDKSLQVKRLEEIGTDYVTLMCEKILEERITPCLHFYTLNTSKATFRILEKLGLLVK